MFQLNRKRNISEAEALLFGLSKQIDRIVRKKFKDDKTFLLKSKFNARIYYRLKEGVNNPTVLSLHKLAVAMGVNMKDLFDFQFGAAPDTPISRSFDIALERKQGLKRNRKDKG